MDIVPEGLEAVCTLLRQVSLQGRSEALASCRELKYSYESCHNAVSRERDRGCGASNVCNRIMLLSLPPHLLLSPLFPAHARPRSLVRQPPPAQQNVYLASSDMIAKKCYLD